MQTGVTIERELSKFANLSVTYLTSRGDHQLFSNVFPPNTPGAPLPTGFNPSDIVYQYSSEGVCQAESTHIERQRPHTNGTWSYQGSFSLRLLHPELCQ